MELQLFPYTEEDFAYCNALIESNMREYFDAGGIQWDRNRYAAEIKSGIVRIVQIGEEKLGFIHLSERGKFGYVNTLQISADNRNRGVGSQLLDWIAAEFKRRGKKAIQLSVFTHSPALNLYKRHGYTIEKKSGSKYLMKKEII